MNRIDRLFAVLLKLQGKKQLRAEDLAQHFGVSKRTIYRDMAALSEMGVPIVSLPGEGYELMEGYYLPPLIFTPAEASALFLGAQLLIGQAAGQLPVVADHALSKLTAILPPTTRAQVDQLTGIIQFILPAERFDLDDVRLMSLQRAIVERRVVHLIYHSHSRNEVTEREIEPHSLAYNNGVWYVNGYCRLREGPRGFRLDRIDDLQLKGERFKARDLLPGYGATIEVRVRFDQAIVRWVRERQHYAFQREEPAPDGLIMTYRVERFSELTPWLLGWGAQAEVLSPLELRAEMRQIAQQLVELLT
jgi:predicted DNA-binding transcriptional regulator YafY